MDFSVAETAQRTGTSVDTIRYYQTIGLLHGPRRDGRNAVYDDSHIERLERIQSLAARGFSLKAIRALLELGDGAESDKLLLSALEQSAVETRYSAAELAKELDIPRAILASIEQSGLVDDTPGDDPSRKFSRADLEVARGAARLLRFGFPITRLIGLAIKHDRSMKRIVDEAIDLFDEHVRKASGDAEDPEAVAEAFRELLPATTALVAHHFQRTLITRALKRLKKSGEKHALDAAVAETKRTRIGFRWK
jgi:DNA-binding transcriptional MerR regulator